MRRLNGLTIMVVILLSVSLLSSCDLYTYSTVGVQIHYENPQWAPPYSAGVRYYYLPDIEAYYDLSARDFVYLSNGQWYYSASCPSNYAGFDLSNCFTVTLDVNIYQPWMHHQYYVSHYPRYYYRDYYDHSNIPYVRGFNENSRSAIYWSDNERGRARNWDSENLKTNHRFTYSKPDRQQQNNTIIRNDQNQGMNDGLRRQPDNGNNNNKQPNRGSDNSNNQQPNRGTDNSNSQQPNRGITNPTPPSPGNGNVNRRDGNAKTSIVTPPRISGFETGARQQNAVSPVIPKQSTNYYGRTIGQPVKVQKQMRQRTLTNPPAKTNTRNNSDSRNQNDTNRR